MNSEITPILQNKNCVHTERLLSKHGAADHEVVMLSEQCVKELKIENRPTRALLRNSSEQVTGPGDAMQIDLVHEMATSGDY